MDKLHTLKSINITLVKRDKRIRSKTGSPKYGHSVISRYLIVEDLDSHYLQHWSGGGEGDTKNLTL